MAELAEAQERRLLAMNVLTPREASIFACLCDTVVAPSRCSRPCAKPTRWQSFDRMLALSPALNRAALRALLYAAELAPLAAGSAAAAAAARLRRPAGACSNVSRRAGPGRCSSWCTAWPV